MATLPFATVTYPRSVIVTGSVPASRRAARTAGGSPLAPRGRRAARQDVPLVIAAIDFALVAVHLYLYTLTGSAWSVAAALVAAGTGVFVLRFGR